MLAALVFAATTAASAVQIRSLDITSAFTSLVPDPPGGRCQGELCTRTRRYLIQPDPRLSTALLRAVLRPASVPTPALVGLACPSTASVLQNMKRAIDRAYHITDNYPQIWLEIGLSDGRALEAYSATQEPFGIPWVIRFDDQVFRSYNPEIGRLLAPLLAGNDPNAPQLRGTWGEGLNRATCYGET